MPPWRIQHESHTGSEQSLRIRMWNASCVQKQSSYTWQEWVRDMTRERLKKFPFPKPLLEARTKPNRYLLDRLRKPYGHWSDVKWKTESLVGKLFEKRHAGSWLSRLPLTINWKIAGTSGWSVPISQSQTTVFVGQWMEWDSLPPCLKWKEIIPTRIRDRSLTSFPVPEVKWRRNR